MTPLHLLVCISSHGFGHLSQTAPVLNALHDIRPDVQFTIRCTLDPDRIRSRLKMPVKIVAEADDIGMLMKDAVTVDIDASLHVLMQIHGQWQSKVDQLAGWMARAGVDAVLSNVGYLPLAAAQKIGLPNVGMSSLRWDAILESAVSHAPDHSHRANIKHMLQDMRTAYEAATHFIRLTPCMALPAASNLVSVGPVCDPGVRRETELKRMIQRQYPDTEDCHLILVGMGGMPFAFSLKHWPAKMPGKDVFYLCEETIANTHPHAVSVDATGIRYSDLIASVDLVLTKPGYGTFVEVAMAGTPVLYVERPHWAETEALTSWLETKVPCRSIARDTLDDGRAAQAASELLSNGRTLPSQATGNVQAALILSNLLNAS